MDWSRLPLARSTVDRAAHRRGEEDLVAATWADASTRVLLVDDGRVATREADGVVELDLRAPADLVRVRPRDAGGASEGLVLFLGEEQAAHGSTVRHLALVVPRSPTGPLDLEGFSDEPVEPALRWSTLREVGDVLSDRDAGLAVSAVGLAAWHERHPRCPRCGAPTAPVQGGWVRRCGVDLSDHYPRTDPAVIMAVTDGAGRLLLGHGGAWPVGRYSTLAGYVEPGESLESAVRREVAEEAGIVVSDVTYRGSQPWPFPASLMLAYTAHAETTDVVVDGVELTDARWFTREELAAAVHGGDVVLPRRTSVALALIEDWFGGPVGGPDSTWR